MPSKQKISDFFDKLDCYLIEDLKTMLAQNRVKDCGSLSYPCLMTIVSGMELMGMLIGGQKNKKAFSDFWKEFSKINTNYIKLEKIFRDTIRNGLAHIFFVKGNINVFLNDSKKHLTRTNRNALNISCKHLYDDFFITYEQLKADFIANPRNYHLQVFLNEINQGKQNVNEYMKTKQISQSASLGASTSNF